MTEMRWEDPELHALGLTTHGPLYWDGIREAYCKTGGRFFGDFRSYHEKMINRLENAFIEIKEETR